MRVFLLLLGFVFLAAGCDTTRPVVSKEPSSTPSDTVRIANDSLEYEIIIFEIGFNSWLATQRSKDFFGIDVLEMRNRRYVREYNRRVYDMSYPRSLYVQEINYDPEIKYGLEVNYLLYHYFLYFEEKYKQKLQ